VARPERGGFGAFRYSVAPVTGKSAKTYVASGPQHADELVFRILLFKVFNRMPCTDLLGDLPPVASRRGMRAPLRPACRVRASSYAMCFLRSWLCRFSSLKSGQEVPESCVPGLVRG
jgi:hypothetical protein